MGLCYSFFSKSDSYEKYVDADAIINRKNPSSTRAFETIGAYELAIYRISHMESLKDHSHQFRNSPRGSPSTPSPIRVIGFQPDVRSAHSVHENVPAQSLLTKSFMKTAMSQQNLRILGSDSTESSLHGKQVAMSSSVA